jgi:lipopolysaccharide/colanic/teichoic acid biosynthesis glycosyltransferase
MDVVSFKKRHQEGETMSVLVEPSIQETIRINLSYLRIKRFVDILFTLLTLPFLIIITIIVAVMIRIDSPGPIFFRQKRVGLNGVEFSMLKFRSMYTNSDDAIHREAIARYMNGQKISETTSSDLPYKKVDDPRITKVGRFLRKTSIDELPQFYNVLRGEMTLVGPRPPLPYEVEFYSQHDGLRLYGKPGLTGYWQVYGRSRVPFASMVEMDIDYLQKQSLREDLKLVLLTVPVMVKGQGGA